MTRTIDIYMDTGISPPKFIDRLRKTFAASFPGDEVILSTTPEQFLARLPAMQWLLAGHPPRGHWREARALRLLQGVGAGIDHLLPLDDLPPGVQVANAKGVSAEPMADFGLALVLALIKRLPLAFTGQRQHTWRRFQPRSVAGSTLAILGCGEIGVALARKAAALGMRVIGTQRRPRPTPPLAATFGLDQTPQVLAEADITVCLLPLTHRTRGFLGPDMLAHMKDGSTFVNLARGGIADEVAIAAMLRSGRLSGAALDVFATEPLPADSPLWDTPNLLITPHVAGDFPGFLNEVAPLFARNIACVERGEAPITRVDVAEGY
ncbi:MAG: D-2-hydroxyacid dehydrogenase [Gammaproteobacteria bacterium]